jgi:hypothetical protein
LPFLRGRGEEKEQKLLKARKGMAAVAVHQDNEHAGKAATPSLRTSSQGCVYIQGHQLFSK